jgi:hypothetical protein
MGAARSNDETFELFDSVKFCRLLEVFVGLLNEVMDLLFVSFDEFVSFAQFNELFS